MAADGLEGQGLDNETPDWWGNAPYADTPDGRAAELIDAGAGRRKIARELDITEHQARQLIEAHR